jgi:hypothetical protein
MEERNFLIGRAKNLGWGKRPHRIGVWNIFFFVGKKLVRNLV